VLLLDRDGRVAVDSFDEDWLKGQVLRHREVLDALKGKSSTGHHLFASGEKVMYVAVPVMDGKRVAGAVMISTSTNDIYEILDQLKRRVFLITAASGVFVALLSIWLADTLNKPINELTAGVEKMARGELRQRVKVRSRDEIGQLASSFNSMSEKLERVDRSRRNFIMNVSHELKSPLGSIKALAESLINGREADPKIYQEFLSDINTEVDRLSMLVQDLLQLMRLEEEGQAIEKKVHSIGKIVEQAVMVVKPIAEQKDIRLEYWIDGHIVDDKESVKNSESGAGLKDVKGEDILWKVSYNMMIRAILNLLDNAIKYTPVGGKVRVEANVRHDQVSGPSSEESELSIAVIDTGSGIPEKDLPYIFDRFYRVDRARSRATGGTGLGLAIVKQIVSLHNGTIYAESKVGVGSIFTIRIPKKANDS